jgi:hypothetical protein
MTFFSVKAIGQGEQRAARSLLIARAICPATATKLCDQNTIVRKLSRLVSTYLPRSHSEVGVADRADDEIEAVLPARGSRRRVGFLMRLAFSPLLARKLE